MSKNLPAKSFHENKGRLKKKKACERWQQHGREHYKNLSEDEKQALAECRKKCYKIRKNAIL